MFRLSAFVVGVGLCLAGGAAEAGEGHHKKSDEAAAVDRDRFDIDNIEEAHEKDFYTSAGNELGNDEMGREVAEVDADTLKQEHAAAVERDRRDEDNIEEQYERAYFLEGKDVELKGEGIEGEETGLGEETAEPMTEEKPLGDETAEPMTGEETAEPEPAPVGAGEQADPYEE